MSHTWTKRLLILGVYIPIYPPSLRPCYRSYTQPNRKFNDKMNFKNSTSKNGHWSKLQNGLRNPEGPVENTKSNTNWRSLDHVLISSHWLVWCVWQGALRCTTPLLTATSLSPDISCKKPTPTRPSSPTRDTRRCRWLHDAHNIAWSTSSAISTRISTTH